MPRKIVFALAFTLSGIDAGTAFGQVASRPAEATLTGVVADPTGAVVPGALLVLHAKGTAQEYKAVAGSDGTYLLKAPQGTRGTLDVTAPGFAPYLNTAVTVGMRLNVKLIIATQTQEIEVSANAADATDPNNNGDALVLKGKDLDQLPTDNTQLQQQINALSGGDAPDIYVDGFSGGKLPPKASIREIRINQNPYSALNDTNPVNGRVEIFTKPGTEKLHGEFFINGNDSVFNSRNPFAPNLPPYYSFNSEGDLGGPINKTSAFTVAFARRDFQGSAIVDAQILDANNLPVGLTQNVPSTNVYTNFALRYDASLGKSSTVLARYQFETSTQANSGVGQLTLPSEGVAVGNTTQTFTISNSQVVSPRVVNDTRFQYIRNRNLSTPASSAPTLVVQGAFNGGGNSSGLTRDNTDRYELQNYVSASEGRHYFTFGGRLRATRDANESTGNYNGTYTFSSLTSYQLTLQGKAANQSPAAIRAAGGGASQFSIVAGTPGVAVAVADVALFFQDDFKLAKNLTFSPGLRFESQTGINNHADWAPRVGLAYGLFAKAGKPAPYTLRGGAGVFYYRFSYGSLLNAERRNGILQQSYFFNNPDTYPAIPSLSALSAQTASSIYKISPTYHVPYFLVSTLALDRRLGGAGNLSVNWVVNRGVHTQLQRNINAPLPVAGTRPFGGSQNIYEYQSEGISNTQRLSVNLNARIKKSFVYGFYQLLSQKSDTDGGFPSNSYHLGQDYGRSTGDVRNNIGIGGSIPLPFGFSSYIFLRAASGRPFDITLGQDLNGDSLYTDRPAFVTDLTRSSVVMTKYGNFDIAPVTGQTVIPRNYGHSPSVFNSFFSLDRTVEFGPVVPLPPGAPAPKLAPGAKAPKPDRVYSLHFSVNVQNVTNHQSLAPPVGVLPAPVAGQTAMQTVAGSLFGKSLGLLYGNTSGNRQIDLQTYFRF